MTTAVPSSSLSSKEQAEMSVSDSKIQGGGWGVQKCKRATVPQKCNLHFEVIPRETTHEAANM